jgi:hypothetical protein
LEFDEDFSLGLVYLSPDGKRMTLIRYNGQHDQSNDPFDLMKPHFQYHVHQATAENLNNGRCDKHPASATRLYASFAEATREFLAAIGVRAEDIAKIFPGNGLAAAVPRPPYPGLSIWHQGTRHGKAPSDSSLVPEFQKAKLPFRSVVVHQDFDSLSKTDRQIITNAVDKQFTSLDEFTASGREAIERLAA